MDVTARARHAPDGEEPHGAPWCRLERPDGELMGWIRPERLAPREAFLGPNPILLVEDPVTDEPGETEGMVRAIVFARTAGYGRKPSWEAAGTGIRKLPEEATEEERYACRAFLSESTAGDLLAAIGDGSVEPWEVALWVHAVGRPEEEDPKHAILNHWARGGSRAEIRG